MADRRLVRHAHSTRSRQKDGRAYAVAAGHTEVTRWLFSLECGFTLADEYVEEEVLVAQRDHK